MSRRASVFARLNPGKRRVRFPDEVMFEESIKESDGDAIMNMLRRASVDIDVDRINMSGMTALHQVIRNVIRNMVVRIKCSPKKNDFLFFLCFFSLDTKRAEGQKNKRLDSDLDN